MKEQIYKYVFVGILTFLLHVNLMSQIKDGLHIKSQRMVGQIEVGSHYVGIEIHKSFPMLNRISFYYPAANSIDISQDYWKRENIRIMSLGLKVGDSPKKMLKEEIFNVDQTPYSVSFNKLVDNSNISISYEFCKDKPAFVVTYKIKNESNSEKDYEVYAKLETILKTSHTYNLIDKAYTEFDDKHNCLNYYYDTIETKYTKLSIINAGLKPSNFTTICLSDSESKSLDSLWLKSNGTLNNELIAKENPARPVAAFTYNKMLKPGENFEIVQIISSTKISDNDETEYLIRNYKSEVNTYKNYVESEANSKNIIHTSDEILDYTSNWAKAVLATNHHYIDGSIQPMPCPAEYNFYFTHDVLLTDLAAVNFDLPRVKKDLTFIMNHSDKNNVIPHAYYWKDSAYVTEYAGSENWNHFWFAIVASRYLRHSNDIKFAKKIFPCVEKSIETAIQNKGKDGLMWSFRPDWWDIGHNFGPRAYMTILGIKAVREFNCFSAELGIPQKDLNNNEVLANSLNENMVQKLWVDSLKYLISIFNDGSIDKHIYMGSLLALHFDELDSEKNIQLMQTAMKNLLDEKLGIYTLFPMDLHLLIDYMGFNGNEAGDPFHYGNGGIWPHGNAWYALGLIKNNQKDEALNFIKKTMTIDGIMNSPNGQPAMYEYRVSDKNDPAVYGKIDKPQFMWAAGWYFYSLYNLFGVEENDWNISFNPYIPKDIEELEIPLTIKGKVINVNISGKGNYISSISYDGIELPAAIIPCDLEVEKNIDIKLGKVKNPYLKFANAGVSLVKYDEKSKILSFSLNSFAEHKIHLEIITPFEIDKMEINNLPVDNFEVELGNNNYKITIDNIAQNSIDDYEIKFK